VAARLLELPHKRFYDVWMVESALCEQFLVERCFIIGVTPGCFVRLLDDFLQVAAPQQENT
jgi:hypothetical protein